MDWLQSFLVARVTGAKEISSDLDRMRSSLPRVNHLMERAEWWRFKSEYIEDLLKELRHAAYDAEDVLAYYDYDQLQKQIEGSTTNQLVSSLTSFTRNLVGNTSSKIKNLQNELDRICGRLENELGPLGLPNGSNPYGKALQRETTSLLPDEVFGREELVEEVLKLMLQCSDDAGSSNDACSSSEKYAKRRRISNLSILPIVGMGGMGKTTLAQQIYNNERVKNDFDLRIWVCVSDYFDLKKITKEMIESANRELAIEGGLRNNENQFGFRENIENLDSLQQILKEKVASRRYLLVLDDVWHDKARDWESLCNPLRFGNKGSMILITTRESRVAEIAGTLDPIKLAGLPDDIFWKLFKKCAFDQCEDSSAYCELESIGKKISAKLKGCPLAAKTLGCILSVNMTIMHWRNILDSELWQLEHDDESYQAALRVSYQYLPLYLKRCFVICSLFPKDFPLKEDALGSTWVSDGVIAHGEDNFYNEKGAQYFADLKRRSFILSPYYHHHLVHDHMHDLAKFLSLDICYCQDETDWSLRDHNSARHLSVYRKPIELIEREISKCEKLRSLLFLDGFNSITVTIKLDPTTLSSLFDKIPYLRLLDLRNCKIEELPKNIGKLKLLFYLNLENTSIRSLPDSLCQLYNLEVINVRGCPIEKFPKMFSKLINLRQIITDYSRPVMETIPQIGMLTSLEWLEYFEVLKEEGHKINELKNMTRLKGRIDISKLENVEGRDDAAQAHLNNKKHLTNLCLKWSPGRDTSSINGDHVNIDEDTLEGLQPHSNLGSLCIENYMGRTVPSWLESGKLPHLSTLQIKGWSNLESLDNCFVSSLKNLCITDCINLLCLPWEWISNSSLDELRIKNCPQLSCPTNLILPSSLTDLFLESCGEFDKSLSSCLQNSRSLQRLLLRNCPHITFLPISQVTDHLRSLTLENCAELQCAEVSNSSTLEQLTIEKCPKLIPRAGPSDADNQEARGQLKYLSHLFIDNTSLLNLPFLRNPPSSLRALDIRNSPEERMFVGDARAWLNGHQNLQHLGFINCCNLESLPEELHTLVKLKYLLIINCPKIQSLPQNGLPPSLVHLYFSGCHPALTEQLKHLDIAEELQTK